MAARTFESVAIDELPAIFRNLDGIAWAGGIGRVQDQEAARLRVAALARLPLWCPDDALDALGGWLQLARLPGEVNGTAEPRSGYRGRLASAWSAWAAAGTKAAIIRSLAAWGLPATGIQIENDYEASPPWPGAWWSRFRIKIAQFGAFGWGAGNDPTPDQIRQMIRQVLFWKWAYAYAVDIELDDGSGYTFTIWIGALIGDYDLAFGDGLGPSYGEIIGGYDDSSGAPLGDYNYG